MIYTSYFAKYHGDNGLSIAVSQPKSTKPFPECRSLRPPYSLVQRYKEGKITSKEYELQYKKQILNRLHVAQFGKILQERVLLCWETPDKFCHRHIVAKWLQGAGFEVKEWETTDNV